MVEKNGSSARIRTYGLRLTAGSGTAHWFTPAVFREFKGFPYYGRMNITLPLEDKLVKEVRKIAVQQNTTLTGLVRDYLEKLAASHAGSTTPRAGYLGA